MASAAEQHQTTLEFYQAMADFKNMFPQMDDDVIEARKLSKCRQRLLSKISSLVNKNSFFQAVLRSNQGAVNTTIDQLLAMSTDNENEKIRSELEENEEPGKGPKAVKQTEAAKSLRSVQKWQPPLLGPLPDSFLRIPQQLGEGLETVEVGSAPDSSMLEDERIAMFLQNEEFMAQLRWNEDFLTTLENGKKLRDF